MKGISKKLCQYRIPDHWRLYEKEGDLYAPAVLIFPLLSDLSVRANKKGKRKRTARDTHTKMAALTSNHNM